MYLRLELLGLCLQFGTKLQISTVQDIEPEADDPDPELDIQDCQYPQVISETKPADPIGFRLEPYVEE